MSKKKIKRPQKYQKPKDRTLKEWWQDQSETTHKRIIGICAAVVAVIVLLLVYYYGIYDDGSLKVKNGALVDVPENWLVGERSSGKNSVYYHFADIATPEGFEPVQSVFDADLQKSFAFGKDNIDVSVTSISNSAEEMAQNTYGNIGYFVGENGTVGELCDYESKLGACKYFVYTSVYVPEDGVEDFSKNLVFYAPTNFKDGSILITSYSADDVDDSALLSAVEAVLQCITLPTGK